MRYHVLSRHLARSIHAVASAARKLVLFLIGPLAFGVACFSGTGPALLPDPDAGGGSIDLSGDAGFTRFDATPGDPFAIDGLTPSHGPFSGGTRARIDGRGFSSKLKVFVDGALSRCENVTDAISSIGISGLAIGANLSGTDAVPVFRESFVGGIDDVRVWARTDLDICAMAGQTDCNTACL